MKRTLKWAGRAFGGILVILGCAYGFIYFKTQGRIDKSYDVNPPAVRMAVDQESLGEVLVQGEHVARTRGCTDCHGQDTSAQLRTTVSHRS